MLTDEAAQKIANEELTVCDGLRQIIDNMIARHRTVVTFRWRGCMISLRREDVQPQVSKSPVKHPMQRPDPTTENRYSA